MEKPTVQYNDYGSSVDYNEHNIINDLNKRQEFETDSVKQSTPKTTNYFGYITVLLAVVSCVVLCGIYCFPPNLAENKRLKAEIKVVKETLARVIENSKTDENIQKIYGYIDNNKGKILAVEETLKKNMKDIKQFLTDSSKIKHNINKIKDDTNALNISLKQLKNETEQIQNVFDANQEKQKAISSKIEELEKDNEAVKKKFEHIDNSKTAGQIFAVRELLYYYCEGRLRYDHIDNQLRNKCQEFYQAGLPNN